MKVIRDAAPPPCRGQVFCRSLLIFTVDGRHHHAEFEVMEPLSGCLAYPVNFLSNGSAQALENNFYGNQVTTT